jgi:amidohydrolase
MSIDDIKETAKQLEEKMVSWRRTIHMNPEVGFQEHKTSALVISELEKLGYEVKTGIGKTGVTGVLKGGEGKVIGIRADMDALEVNEANDVPYKSTVEGVMHACGHDGHTAALIGVAHILAKHKDKLKGTVKLIFQPAEESVAKDDEVLSGAKEMVKDGVLDEPTPDALIAAHIFAGDEYPLNQVILFTDKVSSASDAAHITIKGTGGHGSTPHKCVDAIVVAAEVITAIQTLRSRMLDPLQPAVLSVGTIHGGTRINVIADEVKMEVTIRSFDPDIQKQIEQNLDRLLKGITSAHGADYELKYMRGYPVGQNDPDLVEIMKEVATEVVGEELVELAKDPLTGSEDFWFLCRDAPGVFVGISGANPDKDMIYMNHHPRFDFDESILVTEAAILSAFAINFLEK